MAILTGINTRMRGSAGDWTFSRQGGKTVAKQKIEVKSTPTRSYAQMKRRVQWANLVNLYRAFGGKLKPSFEGSEEGVSDFNEFVGANIGSSNIYLTKDQARQGGCVVTDYMITRGTLPAIGTSEEGGVIVTDLSLGGLTLSDSTTIKEFSNALVQNNEDFELGDQLTCFVTKQVSNATTGVPYVKVSAKEVILSDSTEGLWSTVTAVGFSDVNGKLGMNGAVEGAVAWVHSRRVDGETKVSTESLHATSSLRSSYNTEAALAAAILSYGGTNKEEYLTPNPTEELAATEEGGEDQNP